MWREWMMVGVGLTALVSIVAFIVSVFALTQGGSAPVTPATAGANGGMGAMVSNSGAKPLASAAAGNGKSEALTVVMKSDDEHAKLGPDGNWHDAALPANFTIHAGDSVTITFLNYDTGPHSFTSPSLGTNEFIPAGSASAPSKTTLTFTAPSQAGQYLWFCTQPCDPWAMQHIGYMRGYVTVVS